MSAGTTEIYATVSEPAARGARGLLRLRHGLLAIVLLALIVRLLVVAGPFHPATVTDSGDFDRIAVSLAQYGSFPPSKVAPGPSALRPPLFPLALAGVYKVVGVNSSESVRWRAARISEAVLGAIAVALICLIALRLLGPGIALLSGVIAAVYPPLVLVGSSLLTESLYIPLMLGAVLTALVHRDSVHRWRWAIATGLLVGLGALTRANGIALALPLCFLVWGRPRRSWRALRSPAVVLAVSVLTLVPWTVRDTHLFHQFVPITTDTGYALAGTYDSYSEKSHEFPGLWLPPLLAVHKLLAADPTLDEAQLSGRLDTIAFDFIGKHPAYLAQVAYWNTVRLLDLSGIGFERLAARAEVARPWLAQISVYAFWLLALLAIAGGATRASRRVPLSFWACPLVLLLSAVMFAGDTRYRSPADPFIIVLGALGVSAGWRRVAPVGKRTVRGRRSTRHLAVPSPPT